MSTSSEEVPDRDEIISSIAELISGASLLKAAKGVSLSERMVVSIPTRTHRDLISLYTSITRMAGISSLT